MSRPNSQRNQLKQGILEVQSYYRATQNKEITFPTLNSEKTADICVIGGGYTGLSTALYLAKKGISVILLEANNIASGASGVNGGQSSGGMRKDQMYLEKRLGKEQALALWKIGEQAKHHTKSLIDEYNIECDYKKGIAHPNHKQKYCEDAKLYVEHLNRVYNYTEIEYLDKNKMFDLCGSDGYFGGSFNKGDAHLHPLNYALGIASAAISEGAIIYENSRVIEYKVGDTGAKVSTKDGTVTSDRVILACNGYLEGLEKRLTAKILPMNNYIVATEILSDEVVSRINPKDIAFADSRFVINYFRLSSDNRLLFGGGENYSNNLSNNILHIVTKPMKIIYPFLSNLNIDYAWGGKLAITLNRLPVFREFENGKLLSAQGYSGQGVSLASFSGKIIADKITNTSDMFDTMSRIPITGFPGGRFLRSPSMKIGMAYYALLDRL